MSPDYLFPSRLHDQLVLQWALAQDGADRNAAYGLGNYLFDRKRHEEAIHAWEAARSADPAFATVCRNLGLAYWNERRDGEAARAGDRLVLTKPLGTGFVTTAAKAGRCPREELEAATASMSRGSRRVLMGTTTMPDRTAAQ